MYLLRLTNFAEAQDSYRIEVALKGKGLPRQTVTIRFAFQLAPQDQEDLRWYLEDYIENPHDPAPKIAARIERRLAEIGKELFKAIFQAHDDARDLWANLRPHLKDTRVEVVTEVRESTLIPWELIRDPKTDTPLTLKARSFVRSHPQPVQNPIHPPTSAGPIRILFAICRPGGGADVPFRSVASRLVKGLDPAAREALSLDVLRPPTFERLGQVLREAYDQGQPYHIVHFDGHGDYLDLEQLLPQWQDTTVYPKTPRPGGHGYLAFENLHSKHNIRFVDGQDLGKLLVESGVPVLVLNACRSAHAEAPAEPEATLADPHTQVRAFGSLAQEVMDAGAAGVVGMRYSVYVVTAAQFVADLYASLAQGQTLGQAVTLGRKYLNDDPRRDIAYGPLPLQDWSVPVVYEAAPIAFRRRLAKKKLKINLVEGQATPVRGQLDSQLPKSPDAGFFGRDETLLALDRAFDSQAVVLLHAYAGSGKTATAAEFARWYALTGGVDGPVLFTEFARHLPLARVLDKIGQVFGEPLAQAGINWLALADEVRRQVALQVMRQVPVLWIWDNVEAVVGFPEGTPSIWSEAEQQELVDFLREARETKAKFLITSRREERGWLGDLPVRIQLPPMRMLERVQLARALAEKHGRRLTEFEDWRPLLQFSQGNPLTITVLVGQALRDGLKTRGQIEGFVAKLRLGEAAFADEASEGRDRSLGASLNYGFEHAFSEQERRKLAVLHLFQGFVNVAALGIMGDPTVWTLPELQGLTPEGFATLLDKAAEIGLLEALSGGCYNIHPALPWFFQQLFNQSFPGAAAEKATLAFIKALGILGGYYHQQFGEGHRWMIQALAAEEANLLQARRLALGYARNAVIDDAQVHQFLGVVIATMQGLWVLYGNTSRWVEWAQLVQEIVPDLVDPDTDGPRPHLEEEWNLVTQHRVNLAREERRWPEAIRLQTLRLEGNRRLAAPYLALPWKQLDEKGRIIIRNLGASLHEMAQVQLDSGDADCIKNYKAALSMAEETGDQAGAAICAFNLGYAYRMLPKLHNPAQAEYWCRRSLELYSEKDLWARGKCYYELGHIELAHFRQAKKSGGTKDILLLHLKGALKNYRQALKLLPPEAVVDLAAIHHALGNLFGYTDNPALVRRHYRLAIGYFEQIGDRYHAAGTCINMANRLEEAGRLSDALEYALAARRNFESLGDRAQKEIEVAESTIARIEKALKAKGG
ncbi:MAG: CHAT domain-containing protein [Desulfobaccales bacterium]